MMRPLEERFPVHSEVDLIGPLVLLLAVACVVLLILSRLRLPPTIGYLLSGVLLGPGTRR